MSVPVTDFMRDSIDMGEIAQSAGKLRSALAQAGTSLTADTASRGILSQGEVEAAKIVGAAESAVAAAEQDAAMMGMFGDIAGGLVTGIGKLPKMEDGMPTGVGIGGYKNSYGGFGREKYGSFDPSSVQRDLERINGGSSTLYSGIPTSTGIA